MSAGQVLVDTGPLVAYVVREEAHHRWVRDVVQSVRAPLITCEAVLTEAFFLLQRVKRGGAALSSLINGGFVRTSFEASAEMSRVLALMAKYENVPMSFADACLVRMTELHDRATLLTLDSDFRVYRKNGRAVIKTLSPR